jgi:hypothetical protein
MNKVLIALALVVVGGFSYWFITQSKPVPAPAPPPPPPAPVALPPPLPDASAEPRIQHPIDPVKRRAARTMPELDESDGVMRDGLSGLFGAKRLAEFVLMEGIVRRIVASVDSLGREQEAPDAWPLRPVPGDLQVHERGGVYTLTDKNAARYESRLKLAESVNAARLVDLYARYYPLFQKAYREQGYPKGYFNDRLIEVIDHMLATPEIAQPVRLTLPGVRYHFADPDLQARSAGQKILLRMSPDQATRVKYVLRRIRDEIVR